MVHKWIDRSISFIQAYFSHFISPWAWFSRSLFQYCHYINAQTRNRTHFLWVKSVQIHVNCHRHRNNVVWPPNSMCLGVSVLFSKCSQFFHNSERCKWFLMSEWSRIYLDQPLAWGSLPNRPNRIDIALSVMIWILNWQAHLERWYSGALIYSKKMPKIKLWRFIWVRKVKNESRNNKLT